MEYVPKCQPAEFRLELYSNRVKTGSRYPLWYRATLRNTSCFALSHLSAHDFINGPTFKVIDPEGNEVPQSAPVLNEVNLYSYDRAGFAAMRSDPALRWSVSESYSGFQWYYIRVDPGRSIMTLPSVILPSLNWLQPHGVQLDFSANNPAMKRLIEPLIRGKKIIEPPASYAVVDGYVFKRPGRYRIQAEFTGNFDQVMLHPRYEWYKRHVPVVIQESLDRLSDVLLGSHIRLWDGPKFLDSSYRLYIWSNPVEFEVVP